MAVQEPYCRYCISKSLLCGVKKYCVGLCYKGEKTNSVKGKKERKRKYNKEGWKLWARKREVGTRRKTNGWGRARRKEAGRPLEEGGDRER